MKEIKITERAHKEIKKLYGRHAVNTLKSDPELTVISTTSLSMKHFRQQLVW